MNGHRFSAGQGILYVTAVYWISVRLMQVKKKNRQSFRCNAVEAHKVVRRRGPHIF
jgi:hypothetical protein